MIYQWLVPMITKHFLIQVPNDWWIMMNWRNRMLDGWVDDETEWCECWIFFDACLDVSSWYIDASSRDHGTAPAAWIGPMSQSAPAVPAAWPVAVPPFCRFEARWKTRPVWRSWGVYWHLLTYDDLCIIDVHSFRIKQQLGSHSSQWCIIRQ